jgi:hypothetical protein
MPDVIRGPDSQSNLNPPQYRRLPHGLRCVLRLPKRRLVKYEKVQGGELKEEDVIMPASRFHRLRLRISNCSRSVSPEKRNLKNDLP